MNAKTETTTSYSLDWLKWTVIAALLGGGIVANSYYADESLLYRVLAFIGLLIVSGFIAAYTERGAAVLDLARESRQEIRRVVWPTNTEAIQTTAIVVVAVIMVALLLWGLDSLLSLIVASIIG